MNLASFAVELPSMALAVAGKGALVSLAALGVAAALRRASAASRHLVLTLAVAALLVLPLMTALLPAWELAVPRAETPRVEGPPSGTEGTRAGSLLPLLPLLSLTVSLLLLVRLVASVARLSRLRTGSRSAPAEWQELFDEHRRLLGIARPVRLGISNSVTVPVTFGWWRPMVLIPEAALGWTEQPLREALVHELAHVRRFDWAIQILARAACAVHWLDPLVWLLCRRLLHEAELACDDQVLRTGAGAEGYAERLVALARQVRGSSRRPASTVAVAHPSGLARRVAAILDSGRRRGGPGRFAMAGASAAALLLVLLVAPARLVRAEPERLQAVPQGVEKGTAGALDGADPMVKGVDGVREALPEPATIREGIEEAVEQGVSGALKDEAIREGAHEGANEDAIQDGAREGSVEGTREAPIEAAEAGDTAAVVVQSGVNPDTAVPVDGTPLTGPSREYARILRRILTGVFFEPEVPGEGC